MLNAVFVGNGTIERDQSHIVQSADIVIRSQHCANYQGRAGNKTDILCVRPSNEPFGAETAAEKRIPQDAAKSCSHLIMCSRTPNPNIALLLKNYPTLQQTPMFSLTEDATRELLRHRGARVRRNDNQLNPTMGMCLLHYFITKELYRWVDLTCIGFAWDFKRHDDHDGDMEMTIQREWMREGWFEFK